MNFCHVEFLIKSRIFRYFTFSQPITENSQSYNREFHTVNREFRTLKANFQNSPGLKSPQNEIPNLFPNSNCMQLSVQAHTSCFNQTL